jgi:hypothetical protein
MSNLLKEPQVLYDAQGKRSHVLIPYKKYEKMLELLEDAMDIKAMKEVEHEKTIPWEAAKRKLYKRPR